MLAGQCFACQLQAFLIRRQCQPGIGDFGDQADMRAAPCVFGSQELLQRLILQVGHAAEEVEFIAGEADAQAVLPGNQALPTRRLRIGEPLRTLSTGCVDRGVA